jgi:mono/diheme cytochrome c family protein
MKRRLSLIAAFLLGAVLLAGCQAMADQPRYDPYEPSNFFADGLSARPLVENTVARGHLPPDDVALNTGVVDGQPVSEFPIDITEELVTRGRQRYDIYCTPCHGYTGEGNGMAVQRGFPAPQSLHQDRLRTAPHGYFFQVITNGFGRMPPYNVQVNVEDRWAITAYVRALQLSQSAPAGELPAEDSQQIGGASQ